MRFALAFVAAALLAAGARAGALKKDVCHTFVSNLENAVSDANFVSTVASIEEVACPALEPLNMKCDQFVEAAVEHVASHIPTLDADCDMIVEAQKGIMGLLMPLINAPEKVMHDAMAVSAVEADVLSDAISAAVAKAAENVAEGIEANGEEMCKYCRFAAEEARKWVADPENQRLAIQYAKQACRIVGGGFEETCAQMVDQYAPLSFALAMDYLRPGKICVMAGYCPADPPQLGEEAHIITQE